jgi:hypothetical protein
MKDSARVITTSASRRGLNMLIILHLRILEVGKIFGTSIKARETDLYFQIARFLGLVAVLYTVGNNFNASSALHYLLGEFLPDSHLLPTLLTEGTL